MTVTLTVFDMKWLSKPEKFTTTITEADSLKVFAGDKTAKLNIDLPKLVGMDKNEKRQFVNGGRMYFELRMSGTGTSSYITKGFFDELGYVEPEA